MVDRRRSLPRLAALHRGLLALLGLLAGAFGAACAAGPSPIGERHGARPYTQVSMWVEEGEHIATNYRRGWHLPINTPVEIVDSSENAIVVRVPEYDRSFTIVNEPAYTRRDIRELYERYFGPSKVALAEFPPDVRGAIRNGHLREGMSKPAVLLARGYPPAHRTPTTKADTWIYWEWRLGQRRIEFEDGEVARIEE